MAAPRRGAAGYAGGVGGAQQARRQAAPGADRRGGAGVGGVLALGIQLHRPNSPTDVGVGFVSGMFKTSVGVSGPPVVILLQGRGLAKAAFRATSATVIVVINFVSLVLFAGAGQFDRVVLAAALVSLPALPVGYWLGDRIRRRVPSHVFAPGPGHGGHQRRAGVVRRHRRVANDRNRTYLNVNPR